MKSNTFTTTFFILSAIIVSIQLTALVEAGDTALRVEHGDGHVDHRDIHNHGHERSHSAHHGHAHSVGHHVGGHPHHLHEHHYGDEAEGTHEKHYEGKGRQHAFA